MAGVITINLDPMFEVGPLTLSWHGLTIALGLAVGGWLALRVARERALDTDQVLDLLVVMAVSGM
ncbi:MAG: prolipoprotein diacylglyceryl transferase family protein, partial [bacterium]